MKKNTINILILSSRSNLGGGGEHYIKNIMKYIDRSRFNPIVAIPEEGTLRPALEELGITVVCLGINYGWIKPLKKWHETLSILPDSVFKTTEYIKKNNIQLVHTNSNLRWEGALAARLCGIHHIYAIRVDFDPNVHIYTHFPLESSSFAHLMSSLSTRILSVSEKCAHSLSPPVPLDKITVINNGLDATQYDHLITTSNPEVIRKKLGLPSNTQIITAVGRITPDKGFDIYLEAAIKILKDHPTTHFLIAGANEDRSYADALKKLTYEHNIDKQFHFLGYRNDVAEILAASNIFVLSSRHEGQSNALLEAMACGCAVIATRCSGVEDAIIDEQNGLLIEINDTDALVKALDRLLKEPAEQNRLATAARIRIKTHFQIQDKINQLMELYNEVLSLPPPPPGSPEVTLLLQAAKEIGTLGKQNHDLEKRVKDLEQLANMITRNPLAKLIRSLKTRLFA